MPLDGPQIGTLTNLIVKCYSRKDFKILVRTKLNIVLDDTVSTDDSWRVVTFEFIDNLNREERVNSLLVLIREDRPNVPDLVTFCDKLLGQVPESEFRKAVAAFNKGFQLRSELFGYLNAYKELHDVLHELQSFHPMVRKAVEERKKNPASPLSDDVAIFLEEHLRIARESAKDIEFPERPPIWIAMFITAVEVITGSDVDRMSRQVEVLRSLPSRGLSGLNEKLFENAQRLEPETMISSLNTILIALTSEGNQDTGRLRNELLAFRERCIQLRELIAAHNLCQQIDDTLHEAAGLASVTSESLMGWEIAQKSLDELALQRRDDRRVQRTNEAAKLFVVANQGEAFNIFLERFTDLFKETDKALLRVTNKLTGEAMSLHQSLQQVSQ